MSQIPSVGVPALPPSPPSGERGELTGLDVRDFLDLIIAELQNQDPLNPLENSEMIQQIGQIREIESTQHLTSTLDSVRLGQNVSSATSLIGKHIQGLSADGEEIEGTVDRVTITDGVAELHVATQRLSLRNVREVRAE